MGEKTESRKLSGRAINFENVMLFLLAYTFGKISPNNKIKKVIITTSTKNTRSILNNPRFKVVFKLPKMESLNFANNKTIPIFIKLLATSIVANNFFGLFNSLEMISKDLESFWSLASRSDGVNEKSATSAPEISAEQSSKITNETAPNRRVKLMAWNNKQLWISKESDLSLTIRMADRCWRFDLFLFEN